MNSLLVTGRVKDIGKSNPLFAVTTLKKNFDATAFDRLALDPSSSRNYNLQRPVVSYFLIDMALDMCTDRICIDPENRIIRKKSALIQHTTNFDIVQVEKVVFY